MKIFKIMKASLFTFLSLILCNSCSKDGKEFSPTDINVEGKVEKGPFISGSTINLQPLDKQFALLGSSYSSTITDNEGNFSFGTRKFESSYAQLYTEGYYFNEVKGELSQGQISLRAIVDLTDKSTVNVNIFTHLKYSRIMQLISEGKSFKDANSQAQKELLTAFGLQRYVQTDFSQVSIASGTDEAGALIAISSLILSERSDAEFTEYLAKLSIEFSKNGSFSDATKLQFKTDRTNLKDRLTDIANNIIKRYKDLGKDVTVKNLMYYFDWNDDGTAGNEVPNSNTPVKLDLTEINVPQEGGKYEVKITSSIPYTLNLPNGSAAPIYSSSTIEYMKITPISLTKKLSNNTLSISVLAASGRVMEKTVIYLYDYLGDALASLTINQKGTSTGETFSDIGKEVITNLIGGVSQSVELSNYMDASYTKQCSGNFVAPLSSYDTNISQCWNNYYTFIAGCRSIRSNENSHSEDYLIPYVNTLEALGYYTMITFWGDIPYVLSSDINFSYPRTPIKDLCDTLKLNLKSSINQLDNKKYEYSGNIYDNIYLTKDAAEVILADIYMYQNDYANAAPLLKEVVTNGRYQLDNGTNYSSDSKELIYAVPPTMNNTSTIIPIITYTDVLLSLSECEYHIGDQASAKVYLNEVAKAKSLAASSDILIGIQQLRSKILQGMGGYFAFLKRNNLAVNNLGLKDYQLLFPIPLSEINLNPKMTQNPGY